MRIRGWGRVQAMARRLRNLCVTKGLILQYHRVARVEADPQALCVTPEHFAEQLQVLRESSEVLSLRDMLSELCQGQVRAGTAAITFDDGYADNLYAAKPLLEQMAMPATVFVVSDMLGAQREFWWDDLERILLQPIALPGQLELAVGRHMWHWELGKDARHETQTREAGEPWNVLDPTNPGPRQRIYRQLCRALPTVSQEERSSVLEELASWAGLPATGRATHRPLGPAEVRELADGGLIEIGAHTASHALLGALPVEMQQREILASKESLEQLLGQEVSAFAYPYGLPSQYTRETVRLVREAGFHCACVNLADVVWRGSDPYQLPRFTVRDWAGEEFARQLGAFRRG